MRRGRRWVGLFALTTLAGGLMLVGRATARRGPMDGYYPSAMPRYPDGFEMPAGETETGAATTRMSFFSTKHEPDRVADFYARFWRGHGLWVREAVTHQGGVVSAVDGHTDAVYQVLLMVKAGRTLVFPSMAQGPLRQRPPADPPLVLFPRSNRVWASTTRQGPVAAQTWFSSNRGGLQANLAHYRQALSQAGYRPSALNAGQQRRSGPRKKRGEDHHLLVYRDRRGAEITIELTALRKHHVRVQIVVVEARK